MPYRSRKEESGVRPDPLAERLELYRTLRPFAALPSYEEASRALERRRAGPYEDWEEYVCRLTLTAQLFALAEIADEAPGPHNLQDIWDLIGQERERLAEEGRSVDRLDLEQAALVLRLARVHDKATFCEAARGVVGGDGRGPGAALWRRLRRRALDELMPTFTEDEVARLPGHYLGFDGFRRLVHDLRAGTLRGDKEDGGGPAGTAP